MSEYHRRIEIPGKKQNGPRPKPLEEIHGRRSTYVNRECRCELCREANREYKRKLYGNSY
jgi:hypothetical protein